MTVEDRPDSARTFADSASGSRPLEMITGAQIAIARKLLGWHRGMIAIKGPGITGNTVGKAEGAYPGKAPTPEQLAEIKAVLEAAGIEFTNGEESGVKLRKAKPDKGR